MTVTAVFCAALCAGTPYRLAASENFSVYAPSQQVAEQILEEAELHRRDIAQTWFGEPLAEGAGRTLIHVTAQKETDRGRASVPKPADALRRNLVWISSETFSGPKFASTLKHEITHCLLAAKFPNGLPVWIHEGCASQMDVGLRRQLHQQTIRQMALSDRWADLAPILRAKSFAAQDRVAYGVAVSLAEFLIEREDQATLLAFGAECHAASADIEAALWKHYQIRTVAELQTRWQNWAAANTTNLAARP